MRQDLAEISKREYDHSTFLIIIKDLICKHQRIIALSDNIENLYNQIALMQFLWNTLVICCTGFLIIIVSNLGCSFTFWKIISYLFYCRPLIPPKIYRL